MLRAPELLLPLKEQVDQARRAGDFLLTGSANLLLMSQAAESLAGRAVYLALPPFCPLEWLAAPGELSPLDHLFEPDFRLADWPDLPGDWPRWLLSGGFAPVLEADSEKSRHLWFAGYVQTDLEPPLSTNKSILYTPWWCWIMPMSRQFPAAISVRRRF